MTDREVEIISGSSDETRMDEHPPEESRGPSGAVMQKEEIEAPGQRGQLFAAGDAQDLRSRWERIQVGFVDEPRKAVQEADALVDETVKRLSALFSEERGRLETAWDRRDNVSTEDLRIALRHYRSFFDRLLAL
jgi:hypothetical protein